MAVLLVVFDISSGLKEKAKEVTASRNRNWSKEGAQIQEATRERERERENIFQCFYTSGQLLTIEDSKEGSEQLDFEAFLTLFRVVSCTKT